MNTIFILNGDDKLFHIYKLRTKNGTDYFDLMGSFKPGDLNYEKMIINSHNNGDMIFKANDYKQALNHVGQEVAEKHFSKKLYVQKKTDRALLIAGGIGAGILIYFLAGR